MPVIFDIFLHIATVVIVLLFLRAEVINIFKSLSRTFKRLKRGETLSTISNEEEGSRIAWFIIIGSIPTALIGYIFQSTIEEFFQSLLAIGAALIITGIVLSMTYFVRESDKRRLKTSDALMIGIIQGIALIPGISRSGTTISTGLFLRIERIRVAKYSFLLAVPAILGAALAKVLSIGVENLGVDALSLSIAVVVAAVFSFISLKLLFFVINKARLHIFAPYCIIVGVALVFVTIF